MITEILNDKSEEDIKKAARLIATGKLVAFPTETVYGLGANALDAEAVKKIFSAKGRPQDNPLIVHLCTPDDAEKYGVPNELFHKLAKAFMPGPITVIIPKKDIIPDVVSAGLDSVGIRVPMYKQARELIRLSGVPIAAPSANISGKPSPTKAEHVISDMNGKIEGILCGDDCKVGVESTVVKITGENSLVICRPGGITPEMLSSVCGDVKIDPAVLNKFDGAPVAPGMKYRHYAPEAEVTVLIGSEDEIISYISGRNNFAILCFEDNKKLLEYENSLSIGKENDGEEQASRLFDCLRRFDGMTGIDKIYAVMPEKNGIGLAVWNRLIKAAGFKVTDVRNNK